MHFLLTLLFLVIIFRLGLRLLFGFGRHHHRPFRGGGWSNSYYNNNGYGGDPFGYGQRRGGGLFSILTLVVLDRLIGRRW